MKAGGTAENDEHKSQTIDEVDTDGPDCHIWDLLFAVASCRTVVAEVIKVFVVNGEIDRVGVGRNSEDVDPVVVRLRPIRHRVGISSILAQDIFDHLIQFNVLPGYEDEFSAMTWAQ